MGSFLLGGTVRRGGAEVSRIGTGGSSRGRAVAAALLGLTLAGCALHHGKIPSGARVLVLEPEIEVATPDRTAVAARLRDDLASSLAERGVVPVEEGDAPYAVRTEMIAYGRLKRSWLGILLAQSLAAGIAHGVVAKAATGKTSTAWLVGGGEFALETATWVGGAYFGSKIFDPVIARVTVTRTSDGKVIAKRHAERLRSIRSLRRHDPAGEERVLGVAHRVLGKLSKKITHRVESSRSQPP